MVEEKAKKCKFLLFRHGESEWNAAWTRYNESPEEYPIDCYSTGLLDAPLTKKGELQAKEKQKEINEIFNLRYIFVSPLRRALQTIYILLEEHPNKRNIRVIVHPQMGEKVNVNHDIPQDLGIIREEYSNIKDIRFDFSLFDVYKDPNLYYIYELNDPPREELLNEIEKGKYKESEIVA